MKTEKKLGIWMDHASAHIMEFTLNPAREPNPDTTGIDINSDKTKKVNTKK